VREQDAHRDQEGGAQSLQGQGSALGRCRLRRSQTSKTAPIIAVAAQPNTCLTLVSRSGWDHLDVAAITFRSHSEFSDVIAAINDACEQHRDDKGRLDVPRTLMLTALVTARRRTSGSGLAVDLADAHIRLARRTLGDHPRAAAFDRTGPR
jgi:hypothetical protein